MTYRRTMPGLLLGLAAYAGLFELCLIARPGGAAMVRTIDDVANAAGPLGVVMICLALRPWRAIQPRYRVPGCALLLGAVSFGAGQVVWCYDEIIGGRLTPFPSWADAGYLAAHACVLVAVLSLPRRPISVAFRTRTLLDGLLIMCGVTTYSWYFLLGPVALADGQSLFAKCVSVAYPASELAFVLCLVFLWLQARDSAVRRVSPVLVAALGVVLVADTIYAWQLLHGTYATGELLDPAWALGWGLVALAGFTALRAAGAEETVPGQPEPASILGYWVSVTVTNGTMPLVVALTLIAWRAPGPHQLLPGVLLGLAVLVALSMIHQAVLRWESLQARQQMRRAWQAEAEREALAHSERRIRTLIEDMDVGVVLLDARGAAREANQTARDVLGHVHGELGVRAFDHESPFHYELSHDPRSNPVDQVIAERRPLRGVVVAIHAGDPRWYLLNVVPHLSEGGEIEHVVCTFTEITERQRAEDALAESEQRFRVIFERAPIGILIADMEGRFVQSNRAIQDMLGYSAREIDGMHWTTVVHPDDVAREDELDERLVAGEIEQYTLESRHIRKGGGIVWTRETVSEVWNDRGEPIFAIAMVEDIQERKQVQEALAHQATHDALTGLPNRALLGERLEAAVRSDAGSFALLLMDLDRFKEVNDTLGHHFGDLLLAEVGRRLCEAVRQSDTVARLGGDEFAILLPGVSDASGASSVAASVLASLSLPFLFEGHTVAIGASVGIALYPEHGSDAHTLLRRADVSMYAAKRSGGGYDLYSPYHDQHSPDRLRLIADLRQAIEGNRLVLHYQPKVTVHSGDVRQVEALVRWSHPQRGVLSPDHFIPVAEQTGLIKPLTLWVLDHALAQIAAWRRGGLDLCVAVNLSARNLHDAQLADTVACLLDKHDLPPANLRVELTESTVMADPIRAMDVLGRLRNMGVGIAIDDFGTGYSSLAYLKRLPVDEIKIDKGFVMDLATSPEDAAIVQAVVDLGHTLGLDVVAEGVEGPETLALLASMGCDFAQGYHFSPPLPPHRILDWLIASRTRLAG